jgi:hypothetical protein
MGKGDSLVRDLKKLFVEWDFISFDAEGFSWGFNYMLVPKMTLINYFVIYSRLCTKVFYKSIDMTITLLNVYGPYKGKE